MPKFEFEVGNQLFEIDAADQASAYAKLQQLNAPKTGTEWGPVDRFKPAPGWAPGPLGDLSKQAALPGAVGQPQMEPQQAPLEASQTTAAPGALPTPPADARNASTGSIKPPVLGPAGLSAAMEDSPIADRIVAGVGAAPMKAYQALKQLLGYEPSEDEIRAWRAVSEGPGMAGEVAGNLLMLGAPLGAAERTLAGVSAAGKEIATKAPVLRRALAGMGVAGAEGALLNPTLEGESRLTNALKNAAGAGAIGLGGRIFTGLVRPSKEGQKIIDQGAQPTIKQGGGGVMGRVLGYGEELAGSIPVVEHAVQHGQKAAEKEVLNVIARRASPHGAALPDVGTPEFYKKLNQQFDDAYDSMFKGKRIPIKAGDRVDIRNDVDAAMKPASERASRELERNLNQFIPNLYARMSGATWQAARDNIARLKNQHAVKAEAGVADDKALFNAYDAVEKRLVAARDRVLTPDEITRFAVVDEANAHRRILEKAGDKDPLSMETLAESARKAATPREARTHVGRYQDITEPGATVFKQDTRSDSLGRRLGNYAAATALGAGSLGAGTPIALPLYLAAGLLGSTKPGAKVLMGNTSTQQRLADLLRGRAGTAAASIDSAWE